jgi:3-hydroxyacyl-[acyl-carrier-protein] dehydratase
MLADIPQRAPWLLVDKIVQTSATEVVAEKLLAVNDPLLCDGELPELLIVEALAQAAACLEASARGQHRGMLVAMRGFAFSARPRAGEMLTLRAHRVATLGTLVRVEALARVGERLLTKGELTFAVV